jgi:hypothetical protein
MVEGGHISLRQQQISHSGLVYEKRELGVKPNSLSRRLIEHATNDHEVLALYYRRIHRAGRSGTPAAARFMLVPGKILRTARGQIGDRLPTGHMGDVR